MKPLKIELLAFSVFISHKSGEHTHLILPPLEKELIKKMKEYNFVFELEMNSNLFGENENGDWYSIQLTNVTVNMGVTL